MYAIYEEGIINDRTLRDFSLKDAPQSSREIKVDSDQIKALIAMNDTLKINHW